MSLYSILFDDKERRNVVGIKKRTDLSLCLNLLHVVICIPWDVFSVFLRRYLFSRWHCACYSSVSCLWFPSPLWVFGVFVSRLDFSPGRVLPGGFLCLAWLAPKGQNERKQGLKPYFWHFGPGLGAAEYLYILNKEMIGNGPYAICRGDNTGQKQGNESQKWSWGFISFHFCLLGLHVLSFRFL